MTAASGKVSHTPRGQVLVLVVGEVDIATAPNVRRAIQRATRASKGQVVLDLSGVTFMDCAGLRPLLEAKARLAERLLLRSIPERVADLLRLTEVQEVFGLEAYAAIARSAAAHARVDTEPDPDRPPGLLAALSADAPPGVLELEEQVAGQRATARSRARIDQAKGLVMAIHGCDAEQAWQVLFRASRNHDVQVHDLADALTQAVTGPGREQSSAPLTAALKAVLSADPGTYGVGPEHEPASHPHRDVPEEAPGPQEGDQRNHPLVAGYPGRPDGGRSRARDH
jgi:anti-anti-sigma factor